MGTLLPANGLCCIINLVATTKLAEQVQDDIFMEAEAETRRYVCLWHFAENLKVTGSAKELEDELSFWFFHLRQFSCVMVLSLSSSSSSSSLVQWNWHRNLRFWLGSIDEHCLFITNFVLHHSLLTNSQRNIYFHIKWRGKKTLMRYFRTKRVPLIVMETCVKVVEAIYQHLPHGGLLS